MVQFMSSENNNVWQLPEPDANSFAGEENPVYVNVTREEEPLPKRWKSSSPQSPTQQLRLNSKLPVPECQYNPLNEPSPLGLRLRKSPSLLELAQKRLNECSTNKGDLAIENHEAKRNSKARTRSKASSSNDKLKASHFPALILRIGLWEYVSKHEGDLVAKCYFSKNKIVWEILDGGLKKKFEINWADIVGLKANCAADGRGVLTIVLDKPPLFFKEVNPQPRKHTQWRATSDFTDGEASIHRQHVLQFAQGVLDKNYEKLIQSDTRLNFLSKQQNFFLNFPYFPPKYIDDQAISGNSDFTLPEIYGLANMASSTSLESNMASSTSLESTSLGFIHQDISKEAQSFFSGMPMPMYIDQQRDIQQLNAPNLQPNISMSDLLDQTGNNVFEQNMNLPFYNNVPGQDNPNYMLENILQILPSDNQLTAATSDERTLMSINSLCYFLDDYQNDQQNKVNDSFNPHHNIIAQQGWNDGFTPDFIPQEDGSMYVSTMIPQDYPNYSSTPGSSQMGQQHGNGNDNSTPGSSQMAQQHGNGNDNLNPESNQEPGISRRDSYTDLVYQLPRITSLPKIVFDISESGEIIMK